MNISRRYILALLPLGLVAAAGAAFWRMLDRMEVGKFDPHDIGNPMLGKPVADFSLPGLGSAQGFDLAALKAAAAKQPVLVNFYASWCIPCAQEADVLGSLGAVGAQLWGVAYQDKPDASAKYLDRYGNPYKRLANDSSGRVAIDWGVFGVPETFLVDKNGVIRWHKAGPLTPEAVRDELQPALRSAS